MRILAVLILAVGMMLTSCSKEEWSVTDNFVQETYKQMRDGQLGGHHRCYRIDFPVTIVFPDESTTEVIDRETFITTLRNWKEANPDAEERPTIAFPFTVTRLDSTVVEITSEEDLIALKQQCRQHKNGHRKFKYFARFLNNKCFTVSLPVTVIMADGELVTIEQRSDIKRVLREWAKDRPEEVPELSFPLSVTIKETGEIMEIADQDAFDALVEECQEE